nr:hypothetical protein Itr_chr10CG18840 [Ipomoea trifida]
MPRAMGHPVGLAQIIHAFPPRPHNAADIILGRSFTPSHPDHTMPQTSFWPSHPTRRRGESDPPPSLFTWALDWATFLSHVECPNPKVV